MARAHLPALIAGVVAVAGAVAGGCAGAPPAGADAPRAAEPGSDWRRLPLAPFGSSLQELHLPLHEVLLFEGSDTPPEARAAQEQECYAPDGSPRRFIGRETDSYLLCFRRGRLHRFEVSVLLPESDAPERFAAYCDAWLQEAAGTAPRTPRRCSGAAPDGTAFEATLGDAADGGGMPLLITVHDINSPDPP